MSIRGNAGQRGRGRGNNRGIITGDGVGFPARGGAGSPGIGGAGPLGRGADAGPGRRGTGFQGEGGAGSSGSGGAGQLGASAGPRRGSNGFQSGGGSPLLGSGGAGPLGRGTDRADMPGGVFQGNVTRRGGRREPGFQVGGRGRFNSTGRGGPFGRAGGGPVIFAEGTPANIPPRLSEASHTGLIKSFKSLSVKPERPIRPGYGTMGTPITLRANFFAVKLPKGPIYDRIVGANYCLCSSFVLHRTRSYETGLLPGAKVYTVSIKLERELDMNSITQHLNGSTNAHV